MFWFDLAWDLQHILNPWWWSINIALLVVLVVVGYLGTKRPALAVAGTIILLPTYLFRSRFAFLPFTYLELLIWVTFVSWIVKQGIHKLSAESYQLKKYRWPILVLLVAATIGMFIAPNFIKAAGLWRAYFIEPLMFFVVVYSVTRNERDQRLVLWSLGLATLSVSLLAIFQKFTGVGIYEPSWMAPDHRRVTAMFSSPNAVGLFLAPIVALYSGWLIAELKNKAATILKLGIIFLALVAIWFTKSEGTMLGLAAAGVFLAFFGWNKKITAAIVLGGIVLCLAMPLTRHRAIDTVMLRDSSGQNRVFLWSTAINYLTQNAKNFLLGAGILGFAELQNENRDPLKIEPLLYPHNIILNFWIETGILSVVAILWLIVAFYKRGFSSVVPAKAGIQKGVWIPNQVGNDRRWLALGTMAAMVTILVHGFIDVPYFKNDLAVLFWVIAGLL